MNEFVGLKRLKKTKNEREMEMEKTRQGKRSGRRAMVRYILAAGLLAASMPYMASCRRPSPAEAAEKAAREALEFFVENPKSVRVLNTSEPAAVHGRAYATEEEKAALTVLMMELDNELMGKWEHLNPEDPEATAQMEEDISALSDLRDLVSSEDATGEEMKSVNGWKVEITYEAAKADGEKYRAQYWFVTDKSGKHVVESFRIPARPSEAAGTGSPNS